MPLEIRNLLTNGPISYNEGLALQRELVAARQENQLPDTLLVLEHTPTVTYGKAADTDTNLLLSPEEYAARGIELIPTDRGGDVTYHGPGQLVGYPIIGLGEGNRDLHRYVRALEATVIRACEILGVVGADRADFHAGVWLGDGYLAALGIRVSRWVTHHGFALNVSDAVRDDFATIIPCGVARKRIVTVSELVGHPVSMAEAAEAVSTAFTEWLAP